MHDSALVLFSGGQDSTTCLADALSRFARVETLGFNYGQRHLAEMRQRGVRQLEVGTGSFGDQLLFYQRIGFRVTDIERDFFLQNYTTPLWERGVQHKDMLKLTLEL